MLNNIVIYGLARSGTSYVNMLVAQYLTLANADFIFYDEYFAEPSRRINANYDTLLINDKKIDDQIKRFRLGGILTKIHTNWLTGAQYKMETDFNSLINEHSSIIIVERSDTLDQILSQAVAAFVDRWNNKHTDSIRRFEYPKYTVTKDMFKHHMECLQLLNETRDSFKDILGTVQYEDIGVVNCRDILRNLGFDDEDILERIDESKLFKKMISKEDKLSLLDNVDDVKSWCEEYNISFDT